MSILIQNVLLDEHTVDVYIKGNKFHSIAPTLDLQADNIIDGTNKAILPPFINGHTHAAMTLLRGYADDMDLHTWLNNYIWPLESGLSEEDIYIGAKLACLEMIKTGTTFFNDMYWHLPSTARAVEEMGIRAALSSVFIDFHDQDTAQKRWQDCMDLYEESKGYSDRILFALGPHAIYSVSQKSLERARDFALEKNLLIHIHLCETQKEIKESLDRFGKTPVEYLHDLKLLGPNLCACHSIWLNERDMDLLAEHDVKVIHNPASNLKLCSGFFPYSSLKKRGIKVGLGTDGCSSNNNLDMLEEMKFAALINKAWSQDPTVASAFEIFTAATLNGSRIFRLDSDHIAEKKTADCILVDLDHPQLVPNYHLVSNLVYSANGDCINTTICDGNILMHNHEVAGEQEIVQQAKETTKKWLRQK